MKSRTVIDKPMIGKINIRNLQSINIVVEHGPESNSQAAKGPMTMNKAAIKDRMLRSFVPLRIYSSSLKIVFFVTIV